MQQNNALPRGWRWTDQGEPEQIPYPEPGFDPCAQSWDEWQQQQNKDQDSK
jgi:hypothetical protein